MITIIYVLIFCSIFLILNNTAEPQHQSNEIVFILIVFGYSKINTFIYLT